MIPLSDMNEGGEGIEGGRVPEAGPGASSLRSPEPEEVSAHSGDAPSREGTCHLFGDREFGGIACTFSDPGMFRIRDGDCDWTFEWSDRFGALRVGRRGHTAQQPSWRSRFWTVTALWARQGKRVERRGRDTWAIWEQPPAGLYRYRQIGKRSRLLVECIEPPGFDADFSETIYEEIPRDSDGPRQAETRSKARGEAGPARAGTASPLPSRPSKGKRE